MFGLQLSAEQIEFRDTIRDFVQNEIKPAALHPSRLEPFEKPLLTEVLDAVSGMGLRTLSLPEDAGGAGADTLTACIVLEELAAGDVDLAMTLALTQRLAHALFEHGTPEQRNRWLPAMQDDSAFHIALAAAVGDGRGWRYHRDEEESAANEITAERDADGSWRLHGELAFVPNAPVAKLFVVQARTEPRKTGRNGLTAFVIARETRGLTIGEAIEGGAGSGRMTRWFHGAGAGLRLEDVRAGASDLVGREGQSPLATDAYEQREAVQTAAINLGLGRVAYETAVDYAKIRIQGGRPIIQHPSIGAILADCAVKLELARNLIWKAAWAADHAGEVTDSRALELPLHTMARVYTAEAMNEVALGAAECFGAMGVMRDMPLQKYVHDAHVFLYGVGHDGTTKLEIAEALAGFERARAA